MPERGEIVNRNRAKQLRNFNGLRFGNITPTDIDGMIEYKNKCYVIMETKYADTPILYGQELALVRMCDDLHNAGKPTIGIISSHQISNPEEDIDMAETIVERFRYENKWHGGEGATTKDLVIRFLSWMERIK